MARFWVASAKLSAQQACAPQVLGTAIHTRARAMVANAIGVVRADARNNSPAPPPT